MNASGQVTERGLLVGFLLLGVQSLGAVLPTGFYSAWGVASLVTTNSPAAVGPITRIAAGGFHALALRADGTVFAWGDNTSGQTNVPVGISDVVGISAGARHNLCLHSNGTVVAWGLNAFMQTKVPAGLNGVMAVAAGADHSVALLTNGTVVTWGVSTALTNVPASATNIVAIAAGATVTLALRANGTVVAWGTTANGLTNLPTGLTNVAAVSAGLNHCLGLRSNGTVLAWGDNTHGQIGVPTQLTNATGVSAGWSHSLAQRSDGSYLAWGLSTSGQTAIPVGLTNLSSFAAGNMLNLGVDLAPRFLIRPAANVTIPLGQSAMLSASVLSGSELALQWQINGADLPGETNTDLTITNFDFTRAGVYSLRISNLYAAATATSIARLSNAPTVMVSGVLIGGGTVTRTNSATITLTATTTAYSRLHYTLDGSGPDFTSPRYSEPFVTSNSVTLRAVAYSALVTDKAEAATVGLRIVPTYPLVVLSAGGSVARVPVADVAANGFLSNTLVTLSATPASGWSFMNWSGDASGQNPATEVLMDRPRTVQAVFGTTLNLNINDPSFGQIITDPPDRLFPYGSTVTLSALPNPGRYFFGWAGLLSSFNNPATISATNASGLTALFTSLASNQVSIVVVPVNGGGGLQISPARNVYTNGDLVTVTAWNSSNRVFSHWSGDLAGPSNPLALRLDASKLIYANYLPGAATNLLPVFTVLPGGRSLSAGNSTVLSAVAAGIGPLRYQWRLNGTPLVGATSPSLTLSNLTAGQAGLYDVVASGGYGSVTSPVAPVALFGLELAPIGGGWLPLLLVDCAPGARFSLQFADHLQLTNWSLLAPLQLPSARYYFIDAAPNNSPGRYYRLVPQ